MHVGNEYILCQPHTNDSGIITKQETRCADEKSKEVCPEGAEPCSLQPHSVIRVEANKRL